MLVWIIPLVLIILGVTCYTDIKKRNVPTGLLIALGIVCVISILNVDSKEYQLLFQRLIIIPFILLIWRLGFFGGIDAIIMSLLAVGIGFYSFTDNIVTPATLIMNSGVISLSLPDYNVIRNMIAISKGEKIFENFVESRRNKLIAIFTGLKTTGKELGFKIEQSNRGIKKFNFRMQNPDTTPFNNEVGVWIMPSFPFLLFITLGLIIQLIYGDIMFSFADPQLKEVITNLLT